MKRLHVHVGVTDLDQSIGFYATLFAAAPTVVKDDYAKGMLEPDNAGEGQCCAPSLASARAPKAACC